MTGHPYRPDMPNGVPGEVRRIAPAGLVRMSLGTSTACSGGALYAVKGGWLRLSWGRHLHRQTVVSRDRQGGLHTASGGVSALQKVRRDAGSRCRGPAGPSGFVRSSFGGLLPMGSEDKPRGLPDAGREEHTGAHDDG